MDHHIHVQFPKGFFRSFKNYLSYILLFIYLLLPWLNWQRGGQEPSQAIMIDLPARKGYFFSISIFPDEMYFLVAILILAALGLFVVTSIFGRVWCGFSCPHTVFVDFFLRIERFFQGNRNAQMKLDNGTRDINYYRKKLLTHTCWLILAFSFAFGWVCYFYGASELTKDLISLKVSLNGIIWLTSLTFTTYLFAGFIREKVCIFMCPYGRFQSAMIDKDTKVVHYHDWRGEPRGKLGTKDAGDCINCFKCVHACPMGIDIRDGLQMACIGCGLCIDACNEVMSKLKRPLDLICFDSITTVEQKKHNLAINNKYFKSKNIIFTSVLLITIGFTIFKLLNKDIININIVRMPGPLYTLTSDGRYRNNFVIKLYNKENIAKNFKITTIDNRTLFKIGFNTSYVQEDLISIAPNQELAIKLFVKINEKSSESSKTLRFTDLSSGKNYDIKIKVFYGNE